MAQEAGVLENRLISVLVAVVVTLAASFLVYQLAVPNPVIILAVFMIAFTALANNAAGAASGLCIVLYALYFFSDAHSLVRFSGEGAYKCLVIVLSLALIYLMVATIRKHKDDAIVRLLNIAEQLEKQNETLRDESDHDPLTGVYNRRGGDARIEALIREASARPAGEFQALLAAFDIDDFKEINDVYGHDAGDRALQCFASSLAREFSDGAVLIRYGGDEFHLFVFGEDVSVIESRVRGFSERVFEFPCQEHEISFRVSCGYVLFPSQADREKELYRMADAALYFVKTSGKHKALRYSPDIDPRTRGEVQVSMHSVSENLPVAFLVYRADESEQILLVSNSLLRLCACGDFEEFEALTGGTFRGLVHPDDVERVELSIAAQIRANPNKVDAVDYRVVARDGKVLRIHDLGKMVEDERLGKLFYVVVYDRDVLETGASGA